MRYLLTFAVLGVMISGCGSSLPAEEPAPLNPQAPPLEEALTNTPEKPLQLNNTPEAFDMTSIPPEKDKLINLAKQDLADRLKIDLAQIALVKTTDITWPNISTGCNPGPGQILTKGRIYGYRVWLEVGSDEYIYHTGENDQVILCPRLNPGVNNPLLSMTPDSNETPQSSGK